MTSETFARIVFQSPLPALDREFEYVVPDNLVAELVVGCRVKAPFAGQVKEGFVVAIETHREFAGKLSSILSITSTIPVLKPHIYELLKAISLRQCCSVGELLESAVPKRSVRVEKLFQPSTQGISQASKGEKFAELIRPVYDPQTRGPSFMPRIVQLSREYLESGRSVIVSVPDFRDMAGLSRLLEAALPIGQFLIADSSELGSKRYDVFLNQLTPEPKVVLGTRSVIYSPVDPSSAIIVWDDGDQSHQDQKAPYLSTREVALMRQSIFQSPLHFLSHARSTEVQRLVEIGYLNELQASTWRPKVSLTEGRGLNSTSFQAIKRGLEVGPVLFQVAAPGLARSLYCASCNKRSQCNKCNGPLWLNASQKTVCRWCGQFNLNFKCKSCGLDKLSQGAAGVTRWVEQLGKSFPGIPIREVTAETGPFEVSNQPQIVVATPGIEPRAEDGYSAVVLLDCETQLSRDSLRAPEDALRSWLNALGFMRNSGEAVAVGVSAEVSKALSLGDVIGTASRMLAEREALGFPPARRVVSATGSRDAVTKLSEKFSGIPGVTVLGVALAQTNSTEPDYRLLASFPYAIGSEVAKAAKEFLINLSSKSVRTSAKSGRVIRPVSIKFDDPRVL